MTYIITNGESRHVVDTLEDARRFVACDSLGAIGDWSGYDEHVAAEDTALALPEAGGTIGPLPDGTVIEVRRTA